MNDEFEAFTIEIEKFQDMLAEDSFEQEDFYNVFIAMCNKYTENSLVPYSVYRFLLDDEFPMEEYFLQALMEVYSMYAVDDSFMEVLQKTLDVGDCKEYVQSVTIQIEQYIKDGYVIAYRGEYKAGNRGNLDYKKSVSYSLDYDIAKSFATRFKNIFELEKSVVYTVKVPIEDIVGYNEREEEMVCMPISIGGKMELIKTEDMI